MCCQTNTMHLQGIRQLFSGLTTLWRVTLSPIRLRENRNLKLISNIRTTACGMCLSLISSQNVFKCCCYVDESLLPQHLDIIGLLSLTQPAGMQYTTRQHHQRGPSVPRRAGATGAR